MILTAGIKICGPQKKILSIHLWPLWIFFILQTFLRVNLKNGAVGKLGLVRLAVLTLMAGIKMFGPQKNL